MRILAIDYGKAKIGLAISDNSKKIALPLKTILAGKELKNALENILLAIKDYQKELDTIVIGNPLHMSGDLSPLSFEVEKLSQMLKEKLNIAVILFDERLTTAQSERELKENCQMSRKKRSKVIDAAAATVLLQNFLDAKNF